MKKRTLVLSMCLSTLLTGCSAYSDLKSNRAPDVSLNASVPSTWESGNVAAGQNIFKAGWLSSFNDPKLDAIAAEVLKYNYDLQAAAARVDAAHGAAIKAGAALLPAVSLNLGAKGNGNTDGASASNMGASLDVSWEADLWGRVQAGKDVASNSLAASEADLQFAKQSLVAQATKAYFLAIEAGQQAQYAQVTYDSYKESLKISQAFLDQGLVSIQDVYLAKSTLASAEDALEKTKNAKTQALRSLELLLGKYPSGKFEVASVLPALPADVPAGVPSEILERRPDLISAEREVAAAFGRTTQAKAARLPKLSLTASLGGSSSALSEILNPTNIFWNLASNLVTPLFDGGNAKADVEIKTANQKEAVAKYKKAALAAFADVENALSNEQTLVRRVKALNLAYEQAQMAEKVANVTYEQGGGKLLDVLQIKRSTISANIARIRAEQELLSERVNLYLALGGDV